MKENGSNILRTVDRGLLGDVVFDHADNTLPYRVVSFGHAFDDTLLHRKFFALSALFINRGRLRALNGALDDGHDEISCQSWILWQVEYLRVEVEVFLALSEKETGVIDVNENVDASIRGCLSLWRKLGWLSHRDDLGRR